MQSDATPHNVPTPDRTETPPAAPLTAEEMRSLRTFGRHPALAAACGLWVGCESLSDRGLLARQGEWEGMRRYALTPAGSVAVALLDRLARAEVALEEIRALALSTAASEHIRHGHFDMGKIADAALLAIPTDGAARAGDAIVAERDELARIQDEAERVMDVTLTALHTIAMERYDGPAFNCECHWCGGPDRAHHRDCPTVIARQALTASLDGGK